MNAVLIGDRVVSASEPPYIVAELSGNHRQCIDEAKRLIAAACNAGVDAVKLQTYTPDTLTLPVRNHLFQIHGGLWDGRYLYDLYSEAMTPWEWHAELAEFARGLGIELFSTPFDESAVDYLEDQVEPVVYKIASFELNHIPLLEKVGSLGKPVILSTGMATLAEIEKAVEVLDDAGASGIILLKCISAYPAEPSDFNLNALPTLAEHFDRVVGLSDHSKGDEICHGAVALGACLIEKHIVLDRAAGGIDSGFSLEPSEFAHMVQTVKSLYQGLGSCVPGASEQDIKQKRFRRSIFVSTPINKGEIFSVKNLKIIRPADGLQPSYWDVILGKRAIRDLPAGKPLRLADVGD